MVPSTRVLILLAFAWVGLLFAWCARARVKDGGPWIQPSVSLMASFVGIVVLPITMYLYLAHPAWTWLYLVDPRRVPRLAVVPIAAAAGGAVVGGWYGGVRLIRSGRLRIATGILAGGGALCALVFLLARRRLGRYGTYADFHGHRALPLFQVKLGFVLVVLTLGIVLTVALVAFELWRDGRRVATK